MIKNILWDFDGTLFDTYPSFARAYAMALSQLGVPAPPLERLAAIARESLEGAGRVLAEELGLDPVAVLEKFYAAYAAIPLEEQHLFPAARQVCEAIVTLGGLNLLATHRDRSSTDRFLQANHLAGHFASCLTHDDGFLKKPDPGMFEALIKNHGLSREETLAVGDRDLDVLAGQAAGVRTCAFGPGPFHTPADYRIFDFQELASILRM